MTTEQTIRAYLDRLKEAKGERYLHWLSEQPGWAVLGESADDGSISVMTTRLPIVFINSLGNITASYGCPKLPEWE